jgi:DNA-binding IclR family transcriptional regulator
MFSEFRRVHACGWIGRRHEYKSTADAVAIVRLDRPAAPVGAANVSLPRYKLSECRYPMFGSAKG